MMLILYMIGIIALVLVGCVILLKSNEWLHQTQKKWKIREKELIATNQQLDEMQEQLNVLNQVLEKADELIKKVVKE